ncbi:MAG: 30S ribosomal protein S6 [Alphaproteobacteria bacterium]|nr:30S ribosomal protein S6 [Alphaproteobacteria bacterium]MDE2041872.1 30S ribosomal protein S6 [Alphaproteobacteria bacterium]MDE2341607.1 30S ribosomal protein S6 [Alphaproteobacteria bacterium]
MALYEHVFLARQDLAHAQVEALAATATQIIVQHGGTISKTEIWPLRTLAYKIQKNRKAHYVLLNFEAPGQVVAELERQIQINEDVLRYMTIRIDALEDGPSVLMRRNEKLKISKEQRELREIREASMTDESALDLETIDSE